VARANRRTRAQESVCEQFCKERELTECSFHAWRKRLRGQGPVRFALLERGALRQDSATEASLELGL
jgi:hypothetical protein